jgi:hypothetical protein
MAIAMSYRLVNLTLIAEFCCNDMACPDIFTFNIIGIN